MLRRFFSATFKEKGWDYKTLSSHFVVNHRPIVFDPDKLISEQAHSDISGKISSKFTSHKANLVVVRKINLQDPETDSPIDIDLFTEKFTQKSFDKADFDRHMLMFYSLSDRVYRVRIGEELVNLYPYRHLYSATESVKSKLRMEDYEGAFKDLIEAVSEQKAEGNITQNPWFKYLMGLLAALFGLAIVRSSYRNTLNEKYGSISSVNDNQFDTFVERNCLKCFKPLNPEAAKLVASSDSRSAENSTGDLPKEEPQTRSVSDFRRMENVYTFDCGHHFHNSCVDSDDQGLSQCYLCRKGTAVDSLSSLKNVITDSTMSTFPYYLMFRRPGVMKSFDYVAPADVRADAPPSTIRETRTYYPAPTTTTTSPSKSTSSSSNVSYAGSRSSGSSGSW